MRISFENPLFLWYLISIPLLVITHFILLKHTKKKAMKFANFEALKRVTGNNLITKNWTVLILRLLILSFLVLAASGTILWYEGNRNDNDFVLAIDVSASMSAEDIQPTRLEAAKLEAIDFVSNLKSSGNLGLVSFGGVSIIESIPIDSKRIIETKIAELQIQETGGTDIGGAIVTGTNLLMQNKTKGKVIVLLSDGSNTAGPFIDRSIDRAIEYATQNGVIVHTIGFGTNSGPIGYLAKYFEINATFDESNLQKISNQTHGVYYSAPDTKTLKEAYANIANQYSKSVISVNMSYTLLLAALVILFVEWGLLNTKFRRVP